MALTNGSTGEITSSADNMLGHVLSIAGAAGFTYRQRTDVEDSTQFATSTAGREFTPTLRSNTFDWRAWYDDAAIRTGRIASLAAASGTAPYVTAINSASLVLSVASQDTTVYVSGNVTDRAFLPQDFSWVLNYSGFYDAGSTFPQTETPGVGTLNTFTLTLEVGATDATFSAEGVVTDYQIGEVAKGVIVPFSASVQLTGGIAAGQSPSNSNPLLPDATMVLPTVGETVLTAATGRTFTGDSFVSSMTYDFPVGGLISASGTSQVTGGMTPA